MRISLVLPRKYSYFHHNLVPDSTPSFHHIARVINMTDNRVVYYSMLLLYCYFSVVCVNRLLRAAILSESVTRGDSDSIANVTQMFANWFKHNARFVRKSIFYRDTDSHYNIVLWANELMISPEGTRYSDWRLSTMLSAPYCCCHGLCSDIGSENAFNHQIQLPTKFRRLLFWQPVFLNISEMDPDSSSEFCFIYAYSLSDEAVVDTV